MLLICAYCQFCGDKNSFPLPNDMIDIDPNNDYLKAYYCCMGDCKHYAKRIDKLGITECEHYEEL